LVYGVRLRVYMLFGGFRIVGVWCKVEGLYAVCDIGLFLLWERARARVYLSVCV
jgi:hypothetical protein